MTDKESIMKNLNQRNISNDMIEARKGVSGQLDICEAFGLKENQVERDETQSLLKKIAEQEKQMADQKKQIEELKAIIEANKIREEIAPKKVKKVSHEAKKAWESVKAII